MKFAHFSDAHLGSWSDDDIMMQLSFKAFDTAIDKCIEEKVDFILIAGDLFDTPMPAYDILLSSVRTLVKCKENNIRVYVVPGSHDYSPTHKTFIQVMDTIGLVKNVANIKQNNGKYVLEPTIDQTGAKIYGVMGKAGSLEHEYFENLEEINDDGYKILLFHSALEEYRPEKLRMMPAVPLKKLPKGFDYYATGHVHHKHDSYEEEYGKIVFPGVLFPTEVPELEYYNSEIWIVEDGNYKKIPIKLFDVHVIDRKSNNAIQLKNEIIADIESSDLKDKMVIIKASGELESGTVSDLNYNEMVNLAKNRGAFSVKKNFNKLNLKPKNMNIRKFTSQKEVETDVIKESLKSKIFDAKTAQLLIQILNDSKQEGETEATYQKRIIEDTFKVFE